MTVKMEGLLFMACLLVCGCMAGCDRETFKEENPVVVDVIETSAYVIQEVAEDVIEDKLHLPHDSLDLNFRVFPDEIPH